jgi:hypothetical protein
MIKIREALKRILMKSRTDFALVDFVIVICWDVISGGLCSCL